MALTKECDLVLVGKTGSGKSSLGNSLLCRTSKDEKPFKAGNKGVSVTTNCLRRRAVLDDGTLLSIVDTPGLFDTATPNEETVQEIVKSISLCAPGPHAILFVLSLKRFTKEEIESVEILKKLFGTESMKHVIVVFTGKDGLDDADDDEDVKTIADYVESTHDFLKEFLKECNLRYVGIANRHSSPAHNSDVKNVMKLIYETMEQNDNQVYSQEAFAKAEQLLKEEEERRKKILAEEEREKQRQEEKRIEREKQRLREIEEVERMQMQLQQEDIQRREEELQQTYRRLDQKEADRQKRSLEEMRVREQKMRDEIKDEIESNNVGILRKLGRGLKGFLQGVFKTVF